MIEHGWNTRLLLIYLQMPEQMNVKLTGSDVAWVPIIKFCSTLPF